MPLGLEHDQDAAIEPHLRGAAAGHVFPWYAR
jgi:hypothetical protein